MTPAMCSRHGFCNGNLSITLMAILNSSYGYIVPLITLMAIGPSGAEDIKKIREEFEQSWAEWEI